MALDRRVGYGGHGRGGTVDPDDLARLNSLLGADLRFAVESTCSCDSGCAEPDARAGCGGQSVRAGCGPTREPASTARGVLMHGASGGRQRSAWFPVVCSRARRKLLHSLAGSLAECAMALGLGAGIYRGSPAARGSFPGGSVGLGKSP